VTKVGEWIKVVTDDTLSAWVVLVGNCAVLELTGFVGCQFESSLALETFADVGRTVRCTIFGNA
jgi:hypothetical protein